MSSGSCDCTRDTTSRLSLAPSFLRLGGQFLEVAHRIEVILQDTGDVGLDIRSVGTGIEGDDRYLGDFDFGVLVYREVHQREEPEDHHADEQQDR